MPALRPVLLWRLLAVLCVAAFAAQLARFHHPVSGLTALIQFDAASLPTALPEFRDQPVYTWPGAGGYDGLYYAQLACRPLARDPALVAAMDHGLAYRARRPLVGWVAWALALGDTARVPFVYPWINLACWLALALLLLKLFPLRTAHDFVAWAGLLFSAGALASVRLALTDLPATLLLALAGLLLARRAATADDSPSLLLLAAAGLARETALLAAPAIAAGPWFTWRNLGRLALVAVPLAAWLDYLHVALPPGGELGFMSFAWPGAAWLEKLRYALADVVAPRDFALLRWASLLGVLALTVQAVALLARPRLESVWWRLGLGHAALLFVIGAAVWAGYPGAAARVLLPLHLAFNALAPRTRAGFALLVLGNLTVPAGLLQFADPPRDPAELAVVRTAEVAAIVRPGTGWWGVERDASAAWAWARGDATLTVRAWPAAAVVPVRLRLRALAPRTVEIRQLGRLLWRGRITADWTPLTLPCHAGELTLQTDAPPVPESKNADARALAFCVAAP